MSEISGNTRARKLSGLSDIVVGESKGDGVPPSDDGTEKARGGGFRFGEWR